MQAERVKKAVGEFGAAAKAKLTDPSATGQPEDQLRNPLETLFQALSGIAGFQAGALTLIGESTLSDLRTRPDFSVTLNKSLVGFIEVKAPGKGADPRKWKRGHDKEQWDKLKALPNLLYTDGNDFSLWRDGTLVGEVVMLVGDVEVSGSKLDAPKSLLPLIHDFLTWQPVAPRGVPELARTSARLCRFLRDEVVEQLAQGSKPLEQLAEDWRALLFPDANDEQFADGYAQAVTFGLLMAKSMKLSLQQDLDDVAKALARTNSLIGAALRLLTEEPEQQVLGPSLKTLTRVLDVVDWDRITKGNSEAWLYFYEDFLEVYDNRLRRLTGSYYTPPPVVQAMVRLCDEVLRSKRFGIADGLAGQGVHIADPAMGSGTFLLGVLRRIADTVEANHGGPGAVGPKISQLAENLVGFELQFGAFAVAQLRLLAEMIQLGGEGSPRLFVTDTLSDPHVDFEAGQGIYREISKSQRLANEVKRAQPITVVIGNPPYKEKAKGKGAWIECGSGNASAPLNDWQPPKQWKVGQHAKHLRNLYVYFWRWAAWKVFEQGAGGRDREPPVEECLSGIVCYITVAGFLNGPGFQKMRSDLRRDCDEIWVIDCSPEGHQPEVATRIFQGVQHPVCIVLASRSPANDPAKPARVRFRSLTKGRREEKFAELAGTSLGSTGWSDCPIGWGAPFLPEFAGGWADFVPLDAMIGDSGSGVMPGRTWVIAPDQASLQRRWFGLIDEKDAVRRALLFHPHLRNGLPGDRHIAKNAKGLFGHPAEMKSIEAAIEERKLTSEAGEIDGLKMAAPMRYGFRSFDRQWIIPDSRLINQPNPKLWERHSSQQIYFTAPMDLAPSNGPALTSTSLIPDLHHYAGRGGRVFGLWDDSEATVSNISISVLVMLARTFGRTVEPVEVFAYVAGVLANPAYTERFQPDLIRPGLRVPLTADVALFDEAAKIGRRVIWLHTFGERLADPTEGRPAGPPRLPYDKAPIIPKEGTIPSRPELFPDSLEYDPIQKRLKIGAGFVDRVPQAVWDYQVSGKSVLRQWFSYRRKDREKPQIGDRRPPSPLGDIQPDRWVPEYTSELINLLNVLAMLVELEPAHADLLERICDAPLIPASRFEPEVV